MHRLVTSDPAPPDTGRGLGPSYGFVKCQEQAVFVTVRASFETTAQRLFQRRM